MLGNYMPDIQEGHKFKAKMSYIYFLTVYTLIYFFSYNFFIRNKVKTCVSSVEYWILKYYGFNTYHKRSQNKKAILIIRQLIPQSDTSFVVICGKY